MKEYRIMRVYDGTEVPMTKDKSGQWWWNEPPLNEMRGPYATEDECQDAMLDWLVATVPADTQPESAR